MATQIAVSTYGAYVSDLTEAFRLSNGWLVVGFMGESGRYHVYVSKNDGASWTLFFKFEILGGNVGTMMSVSGKYIYIFNSYYAPHILDSTTIVEGSIIGYYSAGGLNIAYRWRKTCPDGLTGSIYGCNDEPLYDSEDNYSGTNVLNIYKLTTPPATFTLVKNAYINWMTNLCIANAQGNTVVIFSASGGIKKVRIQGTTVVEDVVNIPVPSGVTTNNFPWMELMSYKDILYFGFYSLIDKRAGYYTSIDGGATWTVTANWDLSAYTISLGTLVGSTVYMDNGKITLILSGKYKIQDGVVTAITFPVVQNLDWHFTRIPEDGKLSYVYSLVNSNVVYYDYIPFWSPPKAYANVNSVWKSNNMDYVNVNGVQKSVDSAWVNVGGIWKKS